MNYKEELYHFGVLGMKWGKRRANSTTPKTPIKTKTASTKTKTVSAKNREINKEHAERDKRQASVLDRKLRLSDPETARRLRVMAAIGKKDPFVTAVLEKRLSTVAPEVAKYRDQQAKINSVLDAFFDDLDD